MDAPCRTVLIVSYEFPPTGGGGVQRVAKFARYLPEHGWRPVVLAATPLPGRPTDPTLADEVRDVRVVRTPARSMRVPVATVLGVARSLRGRRGRAAEPVAPSGPPTAAGTSRPSLTDRVVARLASPDHAACWIGPAVAAGVRLGRAEGAEVVVATGPPFSAVVAGERIARRLGVPFVADFRDAWRDNPGAWYPSDARRRRAVELERAALAGAAAVVAASDVSGEVAELGGPDPVVIPNGFDPEDLPPRDPDPSGPLTLDFMGTVYGVTDPRPVLDALASLRADGRAGADTRLEMVGGVPATFLDTVKGLGLDDAVSVRGYLPHREALRVVAKADVGLVVLRDAEHAGSVRPGKIYEYLGMGLPMLLVGPTDGATADLIASAGAGTSVPYDHAAVADAIEALATVKARGELAGPPDKAAVARYDRRGQSRELAGVLDGVTAR